MRLAHGKVNAASINRSYDRACAHVDLRKYYIIINRNVLFFHYTFFVCF